MGKPYLNSKAVAVEGGLQVLVEAWGLECPILPLGGEEEAGCIRESQGLPRGIEQSLLTPVGFKWDQDAQSWNELIYIYIRIV